MLTRCLRFIAIAALAFGQPAFAHHVEMTATVAGTATAVATDAVLTGTVRQLIVEDRTTGKTTTYQTLRLDDGTAVELIGTPTASLQIGNRAQVTGSQTGGKLAVSQFEPLATPQPMQVAAAPSQVQGTLTLAHSDDFAGGHGKFGFVVRPVDGGRATPLVLDLMPDTLRNGMQVIATGSVTADAVSLDATAITIIAAPAPKPSSMTSADPLALTTNNMLVILVKFSDSPVTDPFTKAQVEAVVRDNTNSVASYYNEVSYNKEQLNVTVTPWLQTGTATPAALRLHDHRQPGRYGCDGGRLHGDVSESSSTSFPVSPPAAGRDWHTLASAKRGATATTSFPCMRTSSVIISDCCTREASTAGARRFRFRRQDAAHRNTATRSS